MPRFPILQVDAFTDRPLAGNPCAIVLEADSLSGAEMQAIALEMNLSETAFSLASEKADFRARYFTPAEEIPLAGHPTVALMVALVDSGRLDLGEDPVQVSLELEAGVIDVSVREKADGVPFVTMTQLKPTFGKVFAPEEVASAFGLSRDDVLPGAPVQIVSTGTPMIMLPLASHEALGKARLDLAAYRQLRRREGGFFSVHLFCLEGATSHGDTFARHLGVPPDTVEDPFTGSATGCMGSYLWRHGMLETPTFAAEQGHWMGRPGMATVEVIGPRESIESVRVAGPGVTVMRGWLEI